MRQVMPHRNNIELRRTKSKRIFSSRWKNQFREAERRKPAPFAGDVACMESAVKTGIYMIFAELGRGRGLTDGYMRYADFAGAPA